MGRKLFVVVFLCGLVLAGAARYAHAETVEFFTDTVDDAKGQYKYTYGGGTTFELETTGAHSGEACLKADLDCTQWSGAVLGRNPLIPLVDLTNLKGPAVEFWVKGAEGGENFEVLLIDADDTDGNKTEVGVMASPKYVTVTKEWQKAVIPLDAYPKKGQYWSDAEGKTMPNEFNPKELKEIKFAAGPKYNKDRTNITIYIDDISIVEMP